MKTWNDKIDFSGRVTEAAVLAATFAVALLLGIYLRTELSSGSDDGSFAATLSRDAETLNTTLPEMVSEGIRLDRVAAGPGNSFTYNYTVTDQEIAQNISGSGDRLNELRAQLHERVCTMMPDYRENGTLVKYSLRNNDGAIIAEVSINPRGC